MSGFYPVTRRTPQVVHLPAELKWIILSFCSDFADFRNLRSVFQLDHGEVPKRLLEQFRPTEMNWTVLRYTFDALQGNPYFDVLLEVLQVPLPEPFFFDKWTYGATQKHYQLQDFNDVLRKVRDRVASLEEALPAECTPCFPPLFVELGCLPGRFHPSDELPLSFGLQLHHLTQRSKSLFIKLLNLRVRSVSSPTEYLSLMLKKEIINDMWEDDDRNKLLDLRMISHDKLLEVELGTTKNVLERLENNLLWMNNEVDERGWLSPMRQSATISFFAMEIGLMLVCEFFERVERVDETDPFRRSDSGYTWKGSVDHFCRFIFAMRHLRWHYEDWPSGKTYTSNSYLPSGGPMLD